MTSAPPAPPKTQATKSPDEDDKFKKKFQEMKDRYDQLKIERDALWAENEAMRDTLCKIHSLSAPTPHFVSSLASSNSLDSVKSRKDKKSHRNPEGSSGSLGVDTGVLPMGGPAGTVGGKKGQTVAASLAPPGVTGSRSSTTPPVPAKTTHTTVQLKSDPLSLHNAILNEGSLDMVQRLIEEGQDINYRDKNNWTPLHCCASVGQLEICEALLKKDSITVTGIFALNNDGNGALHYLVRHSPADVALYLRVLNMITEKGADPNLKNRSGETPLHAACFRGNTAAVEFLLSRGANPNNQNNKGETSLHYAVRAGAKALVIELLRFGADPKIAGDLLQGTPLDIAQKQGAADIVTLLKDPKYALIPMTLHSIGMEKYVPMFVALNLEPVAFRSLGEPELSKLQLPEEDRKKILAKLTRMKESPEVNLEELEWEATWDDVCTEKEIGRGHYGVVYKAKWKGREVAVKQLKNPKPELVEEFLGEIEVMKHVRLHENVVNLLGVVKTPHIAIISEFLPMGSLDKLLPNMELDPELVVRIARGTAAGMAFLHAQNIVHRDLACRNLLATRNLRSELTIKITDFGMSRFNKADGPQSEAQQQSGPLKWMAPEALNYEYVKKTDVWSFGVTLVEILLKGGDPYPSKTPMEVALFVRDENGFPSVPPDTPPELEAIMRDCWKYAPDDRSSFEQLVTRLDQYHFKLKRHAPNLKGLGDGKNIVVSDSFEVGFKAGDKKVVKKKLGI